MCRTISVPQAPCGECLILGSSVHLEICTHVVASHVTPDLRCNHEVIHGGIENTFLALGAEGGLDTSQLCFPCLVGSSSHSLEIKVARHLLVHIHDGIGFAGGRECHLGHHLIARREFEGSFSIIGVQVLGIPVVHRTVEADAEVHMLVAGPTATSAVSHQSIFIQRSHTSLLGIVPHGVFQINNNSGIVASTGIGKAIQCHALGGSHLCLNAEAVKQHPVISRNGHLIGMTVFAGQTLSGQFHISIGGHQGDISQVTTSCSAQMHLTEPDYLLACLMIARAPVPSLLQLSRSGIYHAKGYVSAHEYMSMVTGTDLRVHILRKALSSHGSATRQECNQHSTPFH